MIYPFIKRTVDILASLVLILLLSPVWVVTALVIKLTSPGPVFFIQTRGGRGGRAFRSLKFRTMRADHVHDPQELMPLSHPAITSFGRLIRRLKIDELPQVFNVFIGDMSLVGPRPTIMDQIQAYDDLQRRRLEVRPGVTGLAQVNGNAAMSWDERIRYDIYYVDHMGPWFDLGILLKTVLVVVFGESRFARPFEETSYARSAEAVRR